MYNMKALSIEHLKSNKVFYGIPGNTNDLINGLFLTVNTTSTDFDYANAYEMLPKIVSTFYECINSNAYSLEPIVKMPTKEDITFMSVAGKLLIVCSIGMNRNGQKTHIHMWIYNLHSFNYDYDSFCKRLTQKLKGIKGISKRNEFSIKLIPCTDPIDAELRRSNHDNQIIVNYIKNRDYDTLMNYFSTKNSKDFIYFY